MNQNFKKNMNNPKFSFNAFLLICVLLLLSGCSSMNGDQVGDGIKPMQATRELAGAELLDVSIGVFASVELTEAELEKQGLSDVIRQAEQRFVPIHQQSAWRSRAVC